MPRIGDQETKDYAGDCDAHDDKSKGRQRFSHATQYSTTSLAANQILDTVVFIKCDSKLTVQDATTAGASSF